MRPGGPYTITVSNTGFQTETLSNVYLVLEDTSYFSGNTCWASDTVEDVTVVGTRSGILEIGPGSTITSDDLEAIASIERSFGDVLKEILELLFKVVLEILKSLLLDKPKI